MSKHIPFHPIIYKLLCWYDFQHHVSFYDDIRENPELSDVTLEGEKERQFEAHIILLANSNTFFNTFLKSQSTQSIDLFKRAIFFPDSMV